MSSLLRLWLHNPVNATVVKSELQDAHRLFYEKGLVERNMQIRIEEVDKNLGLKPSKLSGMNKNALKEVLNELELDTSDATKLILVQRIEPYLENKSQEYEHNNLLRDCISIDTRDLKPSSICKISNEMILRCSDSATNISSLVLKEDGVNITAKASVIASYPVGVEKMKDMCV